jgi:hypothetical protein
MIKNDAATLVKQLRESFEDRLPANLRGRITSPLDDPTHIRRRDFDIHRIRLLPVRKLPSRFWSSTWCFYEISAGAFGGLPPGSLVARRPQILPVAQIQFFQAPNQKALGDGHYRTPVEQILRSAQAQRPDDWTFTPARPHSSDEGWAYQHLMRRYSAGEIGSVAEDLTWLIEQTLEQFAAMPGC